MEVAAERIARKKVLTLFFAAFLPLALRLTLLPVLPIPVPQAHDEFSHLLAADTFTHGRLSNPVPPAPTHFESFHILVRPSYVSVYPPAQGFALALGQSIANCAWLGVLLSIAAMTASVCWMMQAWVSPVWALLGTILVVIRLGVFSYWMNSYWGGAVAACGGALVLGAVQRLRERPSIGNSFLLGSGIAILATSRPVEGAVFTALSICFPLYKAKRVPTLWPAIAVVTVAVAFIGYYCYRTTGNPFLPPYILYRTTATTAPHFTFLKPRSEQPHWNYEVVRDFYASEFHDYAVARARPFYAAVVSAEVYWRFFVGLLFSVPLMAAFRDKKARLLFGLIALFFLFALAPQVWHSPHYAAPATGLLFLLITLGMRQMRSWTPRSKRLGIWLTRSLVIASALFMVRLASVYPANNAGSRWSGWAKQADAFNRTSVVQQLPPGQQHLVVIRYGTHHDPNREWVYNEADIDQARVVWARDKGPFDNGELLQHFKKRQIWLLEPDRTPPRLQLYPARLMVKPEELAERFVTQACTPELQRRCELSCDSWNSLFHRITGLDAPDVLAGCTVADRRADNIPFQRWLSWLRATR